jgi:hypothetical protein
MNTLKGCAVLLINTPHWLPVYHSALARNGAESKENCGSELSLHKTEAASSAHRAISHSDKCTLIAFWLLANDNDSLDLKKFDIAF